MRAKHIALGLIIFFTGFSSAHAEAYRPYPVIFVHGINSNAMTWGFAFTDQEIDDGKDITTLDYSGRAHEHTALTFKGLMRPYKRTVGGDTLWYIAALNFDDFGGSIDPGPYDSDDTVRYWYSEVTNRGDTISREVEVVLKDKGSGAELKHFIKTDMSNSERPRHGCSIRAICGGG
jgi:hypothetical protein